MTVLRALLLIACLTGLPCSARAQAPSVHTVEVCSERVLARALAQAASGDTVAFACDGVITLTAPVVLDRDLTLDGSNHDVTLDGAHTVRILDVDAGVTATIAGLTIRDGRVSSGASGIHTLGTLTVTRVVLTGHDNALANFGELTILDSTISGNTRAGIYNSGLMTLKGVTIADNRRGIDNASGRALIVNSTFAGNRTNEPNGIGAGIANSGQVTVVNSTFAGNEAPAGGAIGTHRGGTVTLVNTILAGSGLTTNCFGGMIDGGHNLQYPGASCGETIRVADPRLLALADNGGVTATVALGDGSAAVGAGDFETCLFDPVANVDQRGAARLSPTDTSCDVGAFEAAR